MARATRRATGTPNFGGPLATRGGLVFIGAALDRYLRAFDAKSGAELWAGRLPAAAIPVLMGIIANLDRIEGTTF